MTVTAVRAFRQGRYGSFAVVLTITALTLGGVASAQPAADEFTGCLKKGKIDHIAIGDTPEKECKHNETQITWSATGPQGEQGPQGERGPQGDPGRDGQDANSDFFGDQCPSGQYVRGFTTSGALRCSAVTQLESSNGDYTVTVTDVNVSIQSPSARIVLAGSQMLLDASSDLTIQAGEIQLNGDCDPVALGDDVNVFIADDDGGADHNHIAYAAIATTSSTVLAC